MARELKKYPPLILQKFLGYCERTAASENPIFSKRTVAQLIYSAGEPELFYSPEEILNDKKPRYNLQEQVDTLVGLSRRINE